MFENFTRAFFPQTCIGRCGCFDTPLCATCIQNVFEPGGVEVPGFRSVTWLTSYRFPLSKKIVKQLKFHSTPLLAGIVSPFMAELLPKDADVAVPVPLHRARERQRGYNQAALLCESFYIPTLHAITRSSWTRPQSKLSSDKRRLNLKTAFSCSDPNTVRDKRIVLVDDVYTTGSTVRACAQILKENGVKSIDVLIFAKS